MVAKRKQRRMVIQMNDNCHSSVSLRQTVSIYACQDVPSKTLQEVTLTVINMGEGLGQNHGFTSQDETAWSACAFLNGRTPSLSV